MVANLLSGPIQRVVLIFKALHGIGSYYLRERPTPIIADLLSSSDQMKKDTAGPVC